MDYRTEFLLVDMRPIIFEFMQQPNYQFLINLVGMEDLLILLLSVQPSDHDLEGVWSVMEHLLEVKSIVDIDFNIIDHSLSVMLMELDQYITRYIPTKWDAGGYVYHRWLQPTTMLLKRYDF